MNLDLIDIANGVDMFLKRAEGPDSPSIFQMGFEQLVKREDRRPTRDERDAILRVRDRISKRMDDRARSQQQDDEGFYDTYARLLNEDGEMGRLLKVYDDLGRLVGA